MLGVVRGAARYWEAVRVPAPLPPLWKQPLILLEVALTLAGLLLLVAGHLIPAVGLIGVGALVNTVALIRLRIRDADYDLRAKKLPK